VRVTAPPWAPPHLLNRASIGAFNEVWFRKAPKVRRGEPQTIPAFFHPLDMVAGWNRLYGRAGFMQYQFVLPFEAHETLRSIVGTLSASGVVSFLTVLKRFGPGSPGYLSFPKPGWTLALDLPLAQPKLRHLIPAFDEQVLAAGGRHYLAKDSTMSPQVARSGYPRLDEWRAVRDRLDPEHVMRSDLARRLHL
jgi:decaprenylphospho-beta-D-ribofuranose 2-oxidase